LAFIAFILKDISLKTKSTNDDRVLFTIMASYALPIIDPCSTSEADRLYEEYYKKGNVLRVPYVNHIREQPLPPLQGREFEIECVGNYVSNEDIVFSCFGKEREIKN
jgi:hypothetical protein